MRTAQGKSQRRVVKDMALSHADFFRILPGVVDGADYEIAENVVHIDIDGCSVEIRLSAESSRQLSALRLPLTRVELLFNDCSEDEVEAFLANFDLRFQRGGG